MLYYYKLIEIIPWCEIFSQFFWKESNSVVKTSHTNRQILDFLPIKFALWGSKRNNWYYRMFLLVTEKSTDTLLNEIR